MSRNTPITLDTLPLDSLSHDERFDSFARLAATLTGAAVGLVGILSSDREIMTGTAGWSIPSLPLESSLAALLDRARVSLVVRQTTNDPRMAAHPLVTSPPHIQFFAGVPLVLTDGTFVGALSVVDRIERTLTPQQMDGLDRIAQMVVRQLEARAALEASNNERSRLQESLEESESRFRDFFEHTDDFVLSIDERGSLLHCNEAMLLALGASREEVNAASLLRFVDPDDRESFRNAIEQVFASNAPARVETTFISLGGRSFTVDGVLRPRTVNDKTVMARVIFRDVTERKRFENDLENARDAALEAARLKTQFVTNVSHEIRTPMNAIVGMIDILSDSGLTAEQIDHAHYARASAEQLLTLVNNVLSVSTMEAGQLTVANLDFDLVITLRRIVEVMRVAALGKDLTLSLDYDEKLPTIVRGSRTRVSQVVTNLLENAVKFTESGRVSVRIFLQSQTETHRVVRFEVTDTGIGISDDERLLIFERFSQVDATSTRRFSGVGMGLAAARNLVELMGGLIDFESTPGIGSTFWFTIPFPKELDASDPNAPAQQKLFASRILLIDHLPASRQIIQHYLERSWEMTVRTANDAAGLITILTRDAKAGVPIQAVIFDMLPDATIEELVPVIRAIPSIADTPLIYLLGTDEPANDHVLRAAGIAAAVRKPVGQSELNDALTMAFAQKTASQAIAQASAPPRRQLDDVPFASRNSLHVLLAEDNFLNRKLTLTQLQKLGLKTTAVANGKEALETLALDRFDIILMDCQMPILDGYDASLEIRRREKTNGHRHYIIAMTANAREGDREKCFAAGMDDYLSKPTRHEDLSAAIAAFFDRAAQR